MTKKKIARTPKRTKRPTFRVAEQPLPAGLVERAAERAGIGIPHFQYESDSMEKVLAEFRDGIDDVLDALSIVGAGSPGSLELTYALANLRAGYSYLETETNSQRARGAS